MSSNNEKEKQVVYSLPTEPDQDYKKKPAIITIQDDEAKSPCSTVGSTGQAGQNKNLLNIDQFIFDQLENDIAIKPHKKKDVSKRYSSATQNKLKTSPQQKKVSNA